MDRIRVGVLGCGMGRLHALGYQLLAPRCDLRWVADLNPELAGAVADEAGCRSLIDWREGLDDVDAVSICTPHHLHATHA